MRYDVGIRNDDAVQKPRPHSVNPSTLISKIGQRANDVVRVVFGRSVEDSEVEVVMKALDEIASTVVRQQREIARELVVPPEARESMRRTLDELASILRLVKQEVEHVGTNDTTMIQQLSEVLVRQAELLTALEDSATE